MKIRYIVLIILAAIGCGIYFFSPNLETIVQKLVNKYGTQVTGTDVSLQGFALSPLKGEGSIKKILVANPKGYKSPYIFQLDEVAVKIDVKSITSDMIIIESIVIDKPVITYEILSLNQNNLKQLQENIARNIASTDKTEKKQEKVAKTKEKAAKKVLIKKFVLKSATLEAAIDVLGHSEKQSLVMPEIVITNLGGNSESIPDIMARVFKQIITSASSAVTSGNLGNLKNVAKGNLKDVVSGVKDKVSVKGIFSK